MHIGNKFQQHFELKKQNIKFKHKQWALHTLLLSSAHPCHQGCPDPGVYVPSVGLLSCPHLQVMKGSQHYSQTKE